VTNPDARPARPPRSAWVTAHFIVTHRCNLSCLHCYQAEHGKDSGELSLDEWTRVMDEAAAMGVLQLVIGGGEPLARRDFWELLAEARKRRFAVKLFTNGTLVDADVAKRLKDAPVVEVAISLHHANREAGDRFVRRAGALDRINRGIDHLEAAGVRVQVKANVLGDNAHDIPELLERFKDRTLVRLGLGDRLHGVDDGTQASRAVAATEAQLLAAARENASRLDRAALTVQFDEARKRLSSQGNHAPCGAGRTLIVVNPNGDVLPCNQTSTQIMGNVRQRPLEALWDTSPVVARFRAATQRAFAEEPGVPCATCELKAVCNKCMALSIEESGSLTGFSAEVCRSTKTRWQALRERAAALDVECPV